VNRIADQFPDKIISTIAYYATKIPPVKYIPRINVQIMVTTIELSKLVPYGKSTRQDTLDWNKWLIGWLNIVSTKMIMVWDYYSNFRHLMVPDPTLYVIGQNMKALSTAYGLFDKPEIVNYMIQTDAGTGHTFSELQSHLIAEMLNDPNADYRVIIDRFGREYYSDAWKYIRQYIDLIYTSAASADHIINWFDPSEYRNSFLSNAVLKKADELIYKAWKEVLNNQTYMLRVSTVRLQILYPLIELGIATEENILSFTTICKGLGDPTVNEEGLRASEYIKNKTTKPL